MTVVEEEGPKHPPGASLRDATEISRSRSGNKAMMDRNVGSGINFVRAEADRRQSLH